MKKNKGLIMVAVGVIAIGIVTAYYFGLSNTSEYIEFPSERLEMVNNGLDKETIDFLENRIAGYQEVLADEELLPEDRIGYLVAMSSDYQSLGDYTTAMTHISTAAEMALDSQAVQKTYSEMLYAVGAYEQAIVVADLAIKLDPWKPLPWLWRAELEEKLLLEPQKADVIFEQALVETEYDEDVIAAYAVFLERVGNVETAIEVWENAKEIYPERVNVYEQNIRIIRGE